MNKPQNCVFARATRDVGYGRDVVILTDGDCDGRSHPITQTAVDLLRDLIKHSSGGLKLSTLSADQLRAIEVDIETKLSIQLRRHRRPGHVIAANTIQVIDRRTLISEAA